MAKHKNPRSVALGRRRMAELMDEKKKLKSSEDNLAKIEKALQKLHADQARRDALEHLPPEVILRARELSKKGKFQRQIIKRTPKSFTWDTLEFDCGHTTQVFATHTVPKQECGDCLESWLLRRSKQAKKAK